MIRVMIADDEPFIRNCLVQCIDWNGNGFEIVKTCKNGREVVDNLDSCRPDVVITDIKMPYMDGLSLLTYMKRYSPEVRVLVISGYEEFDYVKHAMECDAEGYLLKPLNPDELLEKMCEIREGIDREKLEWRQKNDPKRILLRVINGEDLYESLDVSVERIDEMDEMFYAVACVSTASQESTAKAENALACVCDERGDVFFLRRVWRYLVIVIAEKEASACRESACRTVSDAARELEKRGLTDYRIAVADVCEGLDGLAHAMDEAGRVMTLAGAVNSEKVFYSWNKYSVEYRPFREDINAIAQAVRKRDGKTVKHLLDAIFGMLERRECSLYDIKLFCENLMYVLGEDEAFSAVSAQDGFAQCLTGMFLTDDENVIRSALDEIVSMLAQGAGSRDNSVEALIDMAKSYIDENIADENLSLNKIAKHFNHNPAYFCYVFSNACNMTLSKYIIEQRMERAKNALKNSAVKVLDISAEIGYANPNYFGKLFKRYTGMTPREYRQKYRS